MLQPEDISLLAILLPLCLHRYFIVRILRVLRPVPDRQRRSQILLLGRNYVLLHNPTPGSWCREWRSRGTKVIPNFSESLVKPSEAKRKNDDKRTFPPVRVRWRRAIKYKVHYESGSWPRRRWLMEMNSAERRTWFRRPKDRKRRFFLCTKGLMILLPVAGRWDLLSVNNLRHGVFRVT